ncbi:MAG: hydroxymethylpyrimidine pyrophosphatase-like HAD family hydrolase [Verrucomicrobiales bacterium]|jgi:hydroxymethylpyrimidine pyrophosphatase-like HAD family hydrolase
MPPTFLFSFDFDGTLVDEGPHPAVNPGLNAFLESVQSQGGVWAVNTGRTLFQTLDGLAQHQIRPLPNFIMAKERELYSPGPFNRWVDLGDWNKRCVKEHKRFLKTHRKVFKRVRQFLENETNAQYIEGVEETPGVIATSNEEMERVVQFIAEETDSDPVLSYHRNSIYLRFSHAAYTKGTVLQELARHLGVPRELICTAGDNHNDLSMLCPTVAGYRVCPENAIPEVKEAVQESAGGLIGNGRASFGVMDAIQRLLSAESTDS